MKKFRCVCCNHYTLDSQPAGTFEICPVCYWEDDNIQFEDENYAGGANEVSLKEARENYKRIGAISEKCLKYVREPMENEI